LLAVHTPAKVLLAVTPFGKLILGLLAPCGVADKGCDEWRFHANTRTSSSKAHKIKQLLGIRKV